MKKIPLVIILALTAFVAHAQEAGLRVVASIKPIHSIAAALMEGVGAPSLLITGTTNPHDYRMRPSDAESLQNADVLFWVGPDLEGKSIEAVAQSARIVTLVPDEGKHDEHGHDGQDEHDHDEHGHDEHDHGEHGHNGHDHDEHEHDERERVNPDLHLWLDPHRVEEVVAIMLEALIQTDPDNAPTYRANGKALLERLHLLDENLRGRINQLESGRSYIVFHDAYASFENRYGLRSAGALLSGDPHGHEHSPSAHRLAELRELLLETSTDIGCVFVEPAFDPASAEVLTEGTDLKTVVLDPLGTSIPPGADAYFLMMEDLAASFEEC
ncbi:MAG: zinc ABC transporter substrate-binding protein, partial [Hyphomicrobiales bacterium]|nr:zinc ABC transporter substrate-binding protein [Hyphomicrobiales bacterium]